MHRRPPCPSRSHWWVVAGLALLGACGGGAPGSGPAATDSMAGALAVASPGELARWAQAQLRQRSAPLAADLLAANGVPATAPAAGASPSTSATTERSNTLVQEQGIGEADLLLGLGEHFIALQPPVAQAAFAPTTALRLTTHRRDASTGVQPMASLDLPMGGNIDLLQSGLHAAPDGASVAMLAQAWVPTTALDACAKSCTSMGAVTASLSIAPQPWTEARIVLQRVDITDPSKPRVGERLEINGSLVDSRRIGNQLVVVSVHRPLTAPDLLPAGATSAQREAAIAGVTAADLLPRVRRNGGEARPLLADTDCWTQTANAAGSGNGVNALVFTTISVFDLANSALPQRSRCFAGGTEALYMSAQALYLATTRWVYAADASATKLVYPVEMRTDLHKFTLDAGSASYSGSVPGHLGWQPQRKSFRLSEHDGHLRVLSFTGSTGWASVLDQDSGRAPSPATLSVLRESAGALQTVATLPNARRPAAIGKPGEQVYGVRFVGAQAYVVTFRRTDPLYVLDLADPADPRTVGELDLAGFSEHLFPLPGQLLLGVGRDADARGVVTSLKVALYDMADPANPREAGQHVFGNAAGQLALDSARHGLNWLQRGTVARVALPVQLWAANQPSAQSGLQRYEVDLAARRLRPLPALGWADASSGTWVALDRSLQVDDQLYHLRAGLLQAWAW